MNVQFEMRLIKAKNTKPELITRKFLFNRGLRYTLHNTKLPGKPDIVLPKYNAIVFVHGCFWHLHSNCRLGKYPKNNQNYWIPKLNGNRKRDANHIMNLRELGWRVFVIWECEISSPNWHLVLDRLFYNIKNSEGCNAKIH